MGVKRLAIERVQRTEEGRSAREKLDVRNQQRMGERKKFPRVLTSSSNNRVRIDGQRRSRKHLANTSVPPESAYRLRSLRRSTGSDTDRVSREQQTQHRTIPTGRRIR